MAKKTTGARRGKAAAKSSGGSHKGAARGMAAATRAGATKASGGKGGAGAGAAGKSARVRGKSGASASGPAGRTGTARGAKAKGAAAKAKGRASTAARASSAGAGGSRAGGRTTKAAGAKATATRRAPAAKGGATARRAGVATTTKAVGSSPRAAKSFAGRNDFGVPPGKAHPAGRAPDAGEGLPRNIHGRSGADGDRTHGVGTAPAAAGSGSGGDLDTDFIGVGNAGDGLAQEPPTGVTTGPASTTGGSEEFASGGPAEGRNQLPPGTHGTADSRTYDTVDHSGEDASTFQGGVAADAAGTAESGGELSTGEATGQGGR